MEEHFLMEEEEEEVLMEDIFTPTDLLQITNPTSRLQLPVASKDRYEAVYDSFMEWMNTNQEKSFSENVLLTYFLELKERHLPSTVWTKYSMLRCMLKTLHNVDMSQYAKLLAFIKNNSKNFQSKKCKILTSHQIKQFLRNAPNETYLAIKVIAIFGIAGACRTHEMMNVQITDLEDLGSMYRVRVAETRTNVERSFTITHQFYKIVHKYVSLRPSNTPIPRFFLNYRNGKCISQIIGKNTFSQTPKKIAAYLELPEPERYTGHCFRRNSTTFVVDAGAERDGGWKGNNVAKAYIPDSIRQKKQTAKLIASNVGTSENDKGVGSVWKQKKTAMPSQNILTEEIEIMDVENQNIVPTEEAEASSVRQSRTQEDRISLTAEPRPNETHRAGVEFRTAEIIPTESELRGNKSTFILPDQEVEDRSVQEKNPVSFEDIQIKTEPVTNEDIQDGADFGAAETIPTEGELRRNKNTYIRPCEVEYISIGSISDVDEVERRSDENIPAVAGYQSSQTRAKRGSNKTADQSTQTEAQSTNPTTHSAANFTTTRQPVTMLDLLLEDEQVRVLTGLESIQAFGRLCDTVAELEPKLCSIAGRCQPKLQDRILLTLMKLKTNNSFPCLSAFFHTTTTAAETYFYETLRLMHQLLKLLIPWPSREETQENLPECFHGIPHVRVILAHPEFPTEYVECDEDYLRPGRRTNTLTAEIGISPAGLLTHVSTVDDGRATNESVSAKSGILDKLEAGDAVVTVGICLLRSECEERGVELIEYPSLEEPEDVPCIELAQAHTQRITRRLKTFEILNEEVPLSMAPYFDEIIGVICGLTYLSQPISEDVKVET